MKSNTRWNNVILLSISQALFQTSSFIGSTLSVLVGLQLAPNESLATLPVSVGSLGTALMMIPASLIIRKIGQRKGFMLGTLFGVLAGLLCFYGILFKSFSIFVVGTMLVGCYQGFSQYYRFAAADTVQETNKGKAISFVMTAGPIAMHHCGHSSSSSATVIQWHLLGMFVPSFFTGILIKKIGVYNVILIGILVLCLHVVIALTGTDFMHFISGLIFLGVGWNFMYIGGSTLLTHVYYPAEKEKTQAFHDFLVFAVITGSSFLAGTLLKYWGWHGVNLAIIPLLLLALIKILIARTKKMAQ